jgi:hypothetical protein
MTLEDNHRHKCKRESRLHPTPEDGMGLVGIPRDREIKNRITLHAVCGYEKRSQSICQQSQTLISVVEQGQSKRGMEDVRCR